MSVRSCMPSRIFLSLFRFLPAYLLPFLLFNFSIIQTTLKLVLFTLHLHLHFLFHASGKFQTVAATVRVTARILPQKRSKYSVVGTKTKKNTYIFNFCRFRRSFTNKLFAPKPPSPRIIFCSLASYFLKNILYKIMK